MPFPFMAAAVMGSAIAGGAMASSSAQGASRQSRKFAREQREWDLEVANTAHQREVTDLRLAGLNPILSGTGGAGAPSPSAPGAETFVPHTPDYGAAASSAFSAERAKELQEKQVDLLDAQIRKTDEEASDVAEAARLKRQEFGVRAGYNPVTGEYDSASGTDQIHRDIMLNDKRLKDFLIQAGPDEVEMVKKRLAKLTQDLEIGGSAVAESKFIQEIYAADRKELYHMIKQLGPVGAKLFGIGSGFTGFNPFKEGADAADALKDFVRRNRSGAGREAPGDHWSPY